MRPPLQFVPRPLLPPVLLSPHHPNYSDYPAETLRRNFLGWVTVKLPVSYLLVIYSKITLILSVVRCQKEVKSELTEICKRIEQMQKRHGGLYAMKFKACPLYVFSASVLLLEMHLQIFVDLPPDEGKISVVSILFFVYCVLSIY